MKTTSKILFAAAVALAAATSAQAMPATQGDEVGASAAVETVGWRCGPGWHVNPWGRCVPNRRWRRW
ncbi:MAG TPA: hypothetical protein VED87_01570 [Methylocystis sp.]|nr:hypothetical protein [Methylocystis sp.]